MTDGAHARNEAGAGQEQERDERRGRTQQRVHRFVPSGNARPVKVRLRIAKSPEGTACGRSFTRNLLFVGVL